MVIQSILKMEKRLLKINNGFSYVESLLVMFIIVIIMMIVPVTTFDEHYLKDEEINDEIISLLNYYQSKAYESGEIIVVSFPPRSDTIFIQSRVLGINSKYTIEQGEIYEGNSLANSEISFKGNGVRTGGTIKYYIGDTLYQIVVQLHRGRIRIEKV